MLPKNISKFLTIPITRLKLLLKKIPLRFGWFTQSQDTRWNNPVELLLNYSKTNPLCKKSPHFYQNYFKILFIWIFFILYCKLEDYSSHTSYEPINTQNKSCCEPEHQTKWWWQWSWCRRRSRRWVENWRCGTCGACGAGNGWISISSKHKQ